MAGGGDGGRELDQTPTWAVASVCAVIVVISVVLEKGLHKVGHWFKEKKKSSMYEALEKIKAELMILGFISLILTMGTNYIARICIPEKIADTMLPCTLKVYNKYPKADDTKHRRLLWDEPLVDSSSNRRFLAAASAVSCPYGKVPLVSLSGIHQLHIFIFFLAIFHLLSSAMTMGLGRAKIRGWKDWEKETDSLDYEFSSDPLRFRFARETSFVRQHTSIWNRIPILLYITSFFRQFYRSVRKADYLIMRHGFITAHLAPNSKFNFQKYIKRSLEDDFKLVVGISPVLWGSAVIVLLLNVKGWMTLFWVSLLPLIILLAVGTKLQAIISKMALEIQERHVVIQGIPVVSLHDRHFWFEKPGFVLFLIHFTLFQNAFQIIYFLWIWYEFGLHSCFHDHLNFVIGRVCLGIGVQFLCSYVTLPLYALVSQLGSHMKRSIFDDQTAQALKKWHKAAKNRHVGNGKSTATSPSTTPRVSPNASPVHPIHWQNKRRHSEIIGGSSVKGYNSNLELSYAKIDTTPPYKIEKERSVDLETGKFMLQREKNADVHDFSFGKGHVPPSGPGL